MIAPHGFKEHASGLMVPEAHARRREVWTKHDRRAYEQTIAFLKARGVSLMLKCGNPSCDDPKLVASVNNAGHTVLQCGCTARELTTAV
jgi:hypothetical protein